jgi:hypothetical protein
MKTIRELTGEWLTVYDMLSDPDADEQAIADTLEGIEGEIEAKADNYAVIINELKADAEKIRNEEKRLADRRRALENRVEYLKSTLEGAMLATGKLKFKTPFYSFGIQKNPPTVIIDDAEKIPPEYLVWTEPTVNKKQMLVDMRSGKDLAGVAHLVQTEGLRIR